MESVAVTLVSLVDQLCPDGRPATIAATGGGARSDLWLQIKADLLGAEFIRPACQEPACMGAAMLAAVSVGWFEDLKHAGAAWIAVDQRFAPSPEGSNAYAAWLERYRRATAEPGTRE